MVMALGHSVQWPCNTLGRFWGMDILFKCISKMCLIWRFILIKQLYESGTQFGVAPRKDTKKKHVFKKDYVSAQKNMITISGLIVNKIGGTHMTI
jgi:hypothetical protein